MMKVGVVNPILGSIKILIILSIFHLQTVLTVTDAYLVNQSIIVL